VSRTVENADRIERAVLIDAPIAAVWDLVSQPGWWIGDGNPANRTIVQEGESTLVELILTEKGGGTLLRGIESGFASLAIPAQDRESAVEDSINGWEQQLGRDPGRPQHRHGYRDGPGCLGRPHAPDAPGRTHRRRAGQRDDPRRCSTGVPAGGGQTPPLDASARWLADLSNAWDLRLNAVKHAAEAASRTDPRCQLPPPGWTYAVVVASSTKPRRRRIGRLSGVASTCR